MRHRAALWQTIILVGLLASLLVHPGPVFALPVLVSASPEPDSVLTTLPSEVRLTFDRALADGGTWVSVINENGERFDLLDGHVHPDNRFVLSASLGVLPEGLYRVRYHAISLGGSTVLDGRYTFTIDLPEPSLVMLTPIDGSVWPDGRLEITLQTENIDFGVYNRRIRLYIDDRLVDELVTETATIEGLEPGVHRVRVVLTHFENEELPDTSSMAYISVPQPSSALADTPLAGFSPIPQLADLDQRGITTATLVLLGLGIVLGWAINRFSKRAGG
nr:copper resistance protein CopC [Anaerolineae bacterium]